MDLQTLSRYREWTTLLRLVDALAKHPTKQMTQVGLSLDETNALRGEIRLALRLYKWLRNLYDTTHTGNKDNTHW